MNIFPPVPEIYKYIDLYEKLKFCVIFEVFWGHTVRSILGKTAAQSGDDVKNVLHILFLYV